MAEFSNKAVDFDRFNQVVHNFFGSRFQPSDIKNIWKNIAGGQGSLDYSQFKRLHSGLWSSQENTIDR